MIYLDNAATSLVKPVSVENAVVSAMRSMASPGRGAHEPAMRAAEKVFACREAAARLFNVPECDNIVFTMNATHALNIAVNSLVRPGARVLVSGYEHNSVTRPLNVLTDNIYTAGSRLFDDANTLEEFESKLGRYKPEVVICTHVSNAFGYILPVYEIAELCRRAAVPLVLDASQSAGTLELDFTRLSPAFAAMPGHKGLFGPQGTGILICGAEARPLLSGGSGSDSISQTMPEYLPERLEAGTHNVCGIAGLLAGISYVSAVGTEAILEHERRLLARMAGALSDCEGIELFCGNKERQSGVLSIKMRGIDCEALAQRLSQHGICARPGLHCAPYAHRTAGTLDSGTLRFSFSPFNTEREIDRVTDLLKEININLP